MPITWYVTRAAVAAATDSFEAYGVSVMVGRSELSEAVSIGGELLVVNLAVAGIGDAATDEVFG